jgi:hypothetical protein
VGTFRVDEHCAEELSAAAAESGRAVSVEKATLVTEGDFSANNYAKWFHVAEHESNHDGQIKLLKSRVPGAKSTPE